MLFHLTDSSFDVAARSSRTGHLSRQGQHHITMKVSIDILTHVTKNDIGSPKDQRNPDPDKSARARSLARGRSAAADPRNGYARRKPQRRGYVRKNTSGSADVKKIDRFTQSRKSTWICGRACIRVGMRACVCMCVRACVCLCTCDRLFKKLAKKVKVEVLIPAVIWLKSTG